MAAAGLPDIVPHSGRHVVATSILLHGGTLADVSAALHHKHWGSSARYAHMVTDHAERVLFSLGKMRKNPHHKTGKGRKKVA